MITRQEKLMTYYCPDCGSADVEEMLLGWYSANADYNTVVGQLEIPSLYSNRFFCNECEDCKESLHDKPTAAHPLRIITIPDERLLLAMKYRRPFEGTCSCPVDGQLHVPWCAKTAMNAES